MAAAQRYGKFVVRGGYVGSTTAFTATSIRFSQNGPPLNAGSAQARGSERAGDECDSVLPRVSARIPSYLRTPTLKRSRLLDEAIVPPLVQNYNLNIEYAFQSSMTLAVGYVGSRGERLQTAQQVERANSYDRVAAGELRHAGDRLRHDQHRSQRRDACADPRLRMQPVCSISVMRAIELSLAAGGPAQTFRKRLAVPGLLHVQPRHERRHGPWRHQHRRPAGTSTATIQQPRPAIRPGGFQQAPAVRHQLLL